MYQHLLYYVYRTSLRQVFTIVSDQKKPLLTESQIIALVFCLNNRTSWS